MRGRVKFFVALLSIVLPLSAPILVKADEFNPLGPTCDVINSQNSELCNELTNTKTEDPITGTSGVIVKVTNILTFAAGAIAVVIISLSGIKMIVANGDPEKIKSTRDSIIYTSVGIIVILIARTIVLFVINRLG